MERMPPTEKRGVPTITSENRWGCEATEEMKSRLTLPPPSEDARLFIDSLQLVQARAPLRGDKSEVCRK